MSSTEHGWTRTAPTEPGWYWWRLNPRKAAVCRHLKSLGSGLVCRHNGRSGTVVAYMAGEWSGPISPPGGDS